MTGFTGGEAWRLLLRAEAMQRSLALVDMSDGVAVFLTSSWGGRPSTAFVSDPIAGDADAVVYGWALADGSGRSAIESLATGLGSPYDPLDPRVRSAVEDAEGAWLVEPTLAVIEQAFVAAHRERFEEAVALGTPADRVGETEGDVSRREALARLGGVPSEEVAYLVDASVVSWAAEAGGIDLPRDADLGPLVSRVASDMADVLFEDPSVSRALGDSIANAVADMRRERDEGHGRSGR